MYTIFEILNFKIIPASSALSTAMCFCLIASFVLNNRKNVQGFFFSFAHLYHSFAHLSSHILVGRVRNCVHCTQGSNIYLFILRLQQTYNSTLFSRTANRTINLLCCCNGYNKNDTQFLLTMGIFNIFYYNFLFSV